MKTLVVAPHPDDETLGCGGTLLRRGVEGADISWLIVTGMTSEAGWPPDRVAQRAKEIESVAAAYKYSSVHQLRLATTRLDTVPAAELVDRFSAVFRDVEPEEVFVPHPADAHTDHRIVFDAAAACTKWFRYPSVKRVLAYETLSESDFALAPDDRFRPNTYVDITPHIDRKVEIMQMFQSEIGAAPFPRSADAIRALATLRGAASGFIAAEAFQLLFERIG